MGRHPHRLVQVLSCCDRCNLLLVLSIDSYEMFLFLIFFPMNKKSPIKTHKKQHLNMDRLRTPNFVPNQLQFVWFICLHLAYVCIFAISIIYVFSYSNRFHFENSNTRVHIQLPWHFQFSLYFYWVFCYTTIWNTYLNP